MAETEFFFKKSQKSQFLAHFRTFLAPFLNRWSDKKVHKTKNVGKGHFSIPRAKGFDVTF